MNRRGFLKAFGIGTAAVAFGLAGCSDDPRDKLSPAEHAARAKQMLPGIIDDLNDVRTSVIVPGEDRFSGAGLEPLIVLEKNPKKDEYPRDAIFVDPDNITQANIEAISGVVARTSTYFGRLNWDLAHPDGEGPDAPQSEETKKLLQDIGAETIKKGAGLQKRFDDFLYHFEKGKTAAPAPKRDSAGAEERSAPMLANN